MTRMSVFEADYTLFCDNMDSFNKEFKTPHINEIIYLILKGLTNCFPTNN